MKLSKNLFLPIVLFTLSSVNLSAFADDGVGSGGGGDIQCDNLIQNLVFQDPAGNLLTWIKNGGPEAGKLDLSSSLNPKTGKPYTYADYDKAMLSLINTFAKAPDVNCVSPGDKGYPVSVDDTSKICATSVDNAGIHMTCDRNLFIALTTDQQIEQTHHEFAILVPGLEPDTGSISTYKVSNQLSFSIQNVVERKLVVKQSGGTVNLIGQFDQNQGNNIFNNFVSITDADVSNLANSTWSLIGWAGLSSNAYSANGITNSGSSIPVQLRFSPTTLVGYSLAVNFLNVNSTGSNSGAIGAYLGIYGLQFSAYPDYSGQMTLNACRFISTDFTQMMCIVDDGEPNRAGVVFEYFVKQ